MTFPPNSSLAFPPNSTLTSVHSAELGGNATKDVSKVTEECEHLKRFQWALGEHSRKEWESYKTVHLAGKNGKSALMQQDAMLGGLLNMQAELLEENPVQEEVDPYSLAALGLEDPDEMEVGGVEDQFGGGAASSVA